jgi:ribosomal protein L18E
MSMREVLATVDAALQDVTDGISVRMADLAANDATLRSDFNFIKWAMAGTLNPASTPNWMLRPRRWRPETKVSRIVGDTSKRDAVVVVEIGYEFFGAELQVIQDNVAVAATALAQLLDGLREYSEANGGTILMVQDPIEFEFGQFAGPVSHGFIATVTIIERSTTQ